jgi:hypothetical protein
LGATLHPAVQQVVAIAIAHSIKFKPLERFNERWLRLPVDGWVLFDGGPPTKEFERFHGFHATAQSHALDIAKDMRIRPGPQSDGYDFFYAVGYKADSRNKAYNTSETARVLGKLDRSGKYLTPVLFEVMQYGPQTTLQRFGDWKPSHVQPNLCVHFPNHHASQWLVPASTNGNVSALWFDCEWEQ